MSLESAPPLSRRLLAEFLGAALLAALVIGSGIAAQNLSPNDAGLQLLENAGATAAGLFTIILMFGPAQLSGGALAILLLRVLYPEVTVVDARAVVVPHEGV